MVHSIGITAGGTGGHFYPALAIALEMKSRGFHVVMYISGQNRESFASLAEQNDLETRSFSADHLKQCMINPWRLLKTVFKLRRHMSEHHLEVVLGMGSFAAFPACLAAKFAGIPLVLHEGNAIPGKSNRWLSFFAKAVAVSLPLKNKRSLHCSHIVQTGLPLRTALLQTAPLSSEERKKLYQSFNLSSAKKTLLIFGGSQGARAINDLVIETLALDKIQAYKDQFQILHLTGQEDNQSFIEAYQKIGLTACVKQKEEAINRAYHIADLIICRSGASTISELSLWHKKALFIPLPSAADNHQTANAQVASQTGLGQLLVQAKTSPSILADLLISWLNQHLEFKVENPNLVLCYPDATQRVADLLVSYTSH